MFNISSVHFDIQKIADSGQCFRICKTENNRWQVIASNKFTYVDENETGGYIISCPDEDNGFWTEYFDLNCDYQKFEDSVAADDNFLSAAIEYGKGIRILKQDPWEMLITFIISQRRSIPSIKTCVNRICSRWGRMLGPGIYSFPEPEALSEASLEELCECGLGYRAEYVYLAAKAAAEHRLDMETLKAYNDEQLYSALLSLRGVGAKVANCVMLFGFYRIASFPVDVWIDRVQKEYYNGRFPVEKYNGFAGIIQQYIFFYARRKNK